MVELKIKMEEFIRNVGREKFRKWDFKLDICLGNKISRRNNNIN